MCMLQGGLKSYACTHVRLQTMNRDVPVPAPSPVAESATNTVPYARGTCVHTYLRLCVSVCVHHTKHGSLCFFLLFFSPTNAM